MVGICGGHMCRQRLQVFVAMNAFCSVVSSSVLEAVLGPRAQAIIVTDTQQNISSSSTNTADAEQIEASPTKQEEEKKSSEMFKSLLRREQGETLQRELEPTVLAEFAKAEVLNRVLQSVRDAVTPGPTWDFLKTLQLCAPCQNYEKIKPGKAMCVDGLEGGLVAALSYGIDGNDHWGMAVASKYNIPLHEYDCVNRKPPEVCSGCTVTFHNECIVSAQGFAPGRHYQSLGQQLMDVNLVQVPERSLLLKIDVDSGMEWNILAEEPITFLRKFRQILVAYHQTNLVQNHKLYLQAGKKLEEAGFAVAHLHGNGAAVGAVPHDLEVTYVVQESERGCGTEKPHKHHDHHHHNSHTGTSRHTTMRKHKRTMSPDASTHEELTEKED